MKGVVRGAGVFWAKTMKMPKTWLTMIVALVLLAIGLAVARLFEVFTTAEAVNIWLIAALVLVTAVYARETIRMSKSSEKSSAAVEQQVRFMSEQAEATKQIERRLSEWYENSKEQLEEEYHKAIAAKDEKIRKMVEDEIGKRESIMTAYASHKSGIVNRPLELSQSQVCGTYTVVGKNALESEESYFGRLQIQEKAQVLEAEWQIPPGMLLYRGIGFVVGNKVAFTFQYDISGVTKTGVVLYDVVTIDVLRGWWTCFGVSHLGFEECRRMKPEELPTPPEIGG